MKTQQVRVTMPGGRRETGYVASATIDGREYRSVPYWTEDEARADVQEKIDLRAARHFAREETDRLESAEIAATAPDARRLMSEMRIGLMGAIQTVTVAASLNAKTREAARVREMWAGY